MPVKSRKVKVKATGREEKEEKEKEWWEKILPKLPKPPRLFSSE
nr:hypothetical protein [uncultured bacterium]